MNPDSNLSASSTYSAVLEHFDRISEAPDAIPRLRRFILDLAVRGKLVGQDSKDEPGEELLKRIEVEKERLIAEGEYKKDETLQSIADEEIPFSIPDNWSVIRMGRLAKKLGAGSTPLGGKSVYQVEGVPFLRSQNVYDNGLRLDDVALIHPAVHEKMSGTHIQKQDILLNITGASIGRCALAPNDFKEGNVSQHVSIIRLFLPEVREFIHLSLISPFYQKRIMEVQVGVSREGLSMQRFRLFPMLLPPLAEQHRIVAKVGELMKLCDELEMAQQKRERRRDRLITASLGKLTDEKENKSNLKFSVSSTCSAVSRPEHIQQLRQTILDLAVRGKLVPQDPKDEPASDLLKRIQAYKEQMIREGKIKKERLLPSISEFSAPFRIPSSWAWTRIGICSLITEYGTSVKSAHLDDGVPVLNMGDIQGGQVILKDQKRVPGSIDDLPKLFLKHFDILYNRTNSAELVGKTGIFMGEDDTYTFASYLIRIRFINYLTSPIYANLAMNAPYFRESQIIPELKQQCGQANVNGTKLKNMMIPLPPLAEQHRIVEKVDELLALCDGLEARLDTTTTTRHQLLEATLHEALSGYS